MKNNDNRDCHNGCKPKSCKDEISTLSKQTKKPSSEIGKYMNDKNTKNNDDDGNFTEQKKK